MSTQLTRILPKGQHSCPGKSRGISPSFAVAIAAGLALAGCNRGESQKAEPAATAANAPSATAEMAFARAALERNPDIEVVATDPLSGVVTVKHRSTGQVEAIKASELAAVTPSQLKPMEMQAAPPPEPEPAPVQQESARAPDTGSNQPGTITGNGAYTVDRSGGKIRVSGPGVSIESRSEEHTSELQSPI